MHPLLGIHAATDYARPALRAQLSEILEREGIIERLRARGRRVLLKPNFIAPAPRGDASTTHPDFYMGIAELLLERGFEVGIGESPALGSCTQALRAHRTLDECRERGIEVVEFRTAERYPGIAGERHYRTLTVAGELAGWDSLVNLPKIKTHRQFSFTGATKNLYGCVVGKRKFIRHNLCGNDPIRFARMILANAAAIDCVAHIGDGIEAMHVVGPRGGEAFALGAIIVADDPLAHDLAMCRLIDLDPRTTALFSALDDTMFEALARRVEPMIEASGFEPATDFVHAPQIHISFSPWAVVRSGLRTLRYRTGLAAPG